MRLGRRCILTSMMRGGSGGCRRELDPGKGRGGGGARGRRGGGEVWVSREEDVVVESGQDES